MMMSAATDTIETGERRLGRYIAEVAVLSEICSIAQSTLKLLDGQIVYANLVFFFVLTLPMLGYVRYRRKEIFLILIFALFLALKVSFQGSGGYFQKAFSLLLTIVWYMVLARRTSFDEISAACTKFRAFILAVGLVYAATWYVFHTYRNAATMTIVLMLVLAYRPVWSFVASAVFVVLMKTQYKIWLMASLAATFVTPAKLRILAALAAGAGAALLPLALLFADLSWLGFSYSEMTSLNERLGEVAAFLDGIGGRIQYMLVGWPIGQALVSEAASERGYMHSTYLWFAGTLGVPATLLLSLYIFTRPTSSSRTFFVRLFLILANSMTFLFLTNPLCTLLMLADDQKKAH